MSVFSDNLRNARKEKGLTQMQLSEILDISRDTLYNWENDLRKPDIGQLQRLCEIFECDSGYLLGEFGTKRAASAPLAEITRLTSNALDHLITAAGTGNPYIHIISMLLEDETLLTRMAICANSDYGQVSTIIDITDPFMPSGSHGLILSPEQLRTADKMELYNALCNFIDNSRQLKIDGVGNTNT